LPASLIRMGYTPLREGDVSVRFEITVFPNNQGGVRFLMQEVESRRVLRQGQLATEEDVSETGIAHGIPEVPVADRGALVELMKRVVESWYPEKYSPTPPI
jgi:hypothetical protein